MINGDVARLKQLFLNLIDNSVKYSNSHGKITLSLKKDDNKAVISIKDNGIGIPRREQAKIFERFYRVERKSKIFTDSGGSGLGLPIAKWIAEAHGGSIEVKSREGKGSTFIVRIPIS
jgi:two-component system phosphate regulon sensor histidine kinase PhoR